MRYRRVWVRAVLAGVLVVLLTACAGQQATPAPAAPLRFAWTYREGDYTLLLAQQMGLFQRYGVNVEPVLYDSYSQARADMVAEVIDGGIFPIGDLLLMASKTDLQGVFVSDNGGIAAVVAAAEIGNVRDLRGKRIGVTLHTSSEMFISYMLETAGLTSRDVTLIEMKPQDVPASIPEVVDAGFVVEPYTSQAMRQGLRLLYSSERYGSLLPNLIVFRQRVVQEQPQRVRAFVRAWNEAAAYRIAHPQEASAILEQVTGRPARELGLSGTVTFYTLEDNRRFFAENPGLDPGSIYYVAQRNLYFLTSLGDISQPLDLNTLLNPSFLQE